LVAALGLWLLLKLPTAKDAAGTDTGIAFVIAEQKKKFVGTLS